MTFLAILKYQLKILTITISVIIIIFSIIPFYLACISTRKIVCIFAKLFRPDLGPVLTAENASFAMGPFNKAQENIIVTFVLSGKVSLENVVDSVEKNIFSGENAEKFNLLKCTWEIFGGWTFWKLDEKFDLKNHLRNFEEEVKVTEKNLQEILEELFEKGWDREKSPWEILRVEEFQFEGQHSTLFIFRMDHALGDGFSISTFIKTFSKSEFPIPKLRFNERRLRIWEKFWRVLKAPVDVARNLETAFGAVGLKSVRDVEGEVVSVSGIVDVEIVKRIKNHFKVNYATVLYAITCGAIERALKDSGVEPPAKLKGGFIIPKRNHPGGICIYVSTTLTAWPIKSSSPEDRLWKIQKDLEFISNSSLAIAYDKVAILFGSGPQWLGRIFSSQGKSYCDQVGLGATLTNFPVSTRPDFFQSHEFLDLTLGVSTLEPSGIISDTGGLNNKQRFNFNIRRCLFASDDICRNMGVYALEELSALLAATV